MRIQGVTLNMWKLHPSWEEVGQLGGGHFQKALDHLRVRLKPSGSSGLVACQRSVFVINMASLWLLAQSHYVTIAAMCVIKQRGGPHQMLLGSPVSRM